MAGRWEHPREEKDARCVCVSANLYTHDGHTCNGPVKLYVDMRRRVVRCKFKFFKRGIIYLLMY